MDLQFQIDFKKWTTKDFQHLIQFSPVHLHTAYYQTYIYARTKSNPELPVHTMQNHGLGNALASQQLSQSHSEGLETRFLKFEDDTKLSRAQTVQ